MALPYPLDRLAGCICRAQRYMGWMGPSRRGGTVCAVVAIVAWVSLLRAATATSASCPYTAYEGVDLNGGDLPNQPASKTLSTMDQCAALCCSMGFPCAAFALNAGSPNSRRLAVARSASLLAPCVFVTTCSQPDLISCDAFLWRLHRPAARVALSLAVFLTHIR